MKILMVEDNHSVCEMMAMFFKKEKWDADFAYDGEAAVEMYEKGSDDIDIVLLDLNLPKKDGMQVAADIRRTSPTVPIIMLTARDSESDQVLGLEMGADDYVTKPFSNRELVARVKANLRRQDVAATAADNRKADIKVGDLTIHSDAYTVTKRGENINLTHREFELLHYLAEVAGKDRR